MPQQMPKQGGTGKQDQKPGQTPTKEQKQGQQPSKQGPDMAQERIGKRHEPSDGQPMTPKRGQQ